MDYVQAIIWAHYLTKVVIELIPDPNMCIFFEKDMV